MEVEFRTDRTPAVFGEPQLSASPVIDEVAAKTRAAAHGGVPLAHHESVHQPKRRKSGMSFQKIAQDDIGFAGSRVLVMLFS